MRKRFAWTIAGFAITVLVPASSARTQVFRSENRTVPVYATVTDATGQIVSSLRQSDFEISDNGKKQAISLFHAGSQEITAAVLLDRSPSLFSVEDRSKDAVSEFVHQLIAGDRVCLGTFSQVVSLVPTLTDDASILLAHLGDDVPFAAGTAVWDAIQAGHDALAREGGRRVIVVVTDASDNCSRVNVDDMRSSLVNDGVMLYGIGLRGTEGLRSNELGALARATGGWFFEMASTDDLKATVTRVADELHKQYLIGFTPQVFDEKVHRIDVKVSKGGFIVHARKSYFATAKADVR